MTAKSPSRMDCPSCDRTFVDADALQQHRERKHFKPVGGVYQRYEPVEYGSLSILPAMLAAMSLGKRGRL